MALLCLLIPVALFWRPSFFFIRDDWRTLTLMVDLPFGRFVLTPEGEQWFPFFHLAYYGLITVFGDSYLFLNLAACLAAGLNAFLFYLLLRRQFNAGLALGLGLLYAAGAAHNSTAPMVFYLCYSLSLGFLLAALLLTDWYLRSPSFWLLLLIGLIAGLSVTSHNYTLPALPAIAVYPWLMGEKEARRRFWPLAGLVAAVMAGYLLAYWNFAGFKAAASIHKGIFGALPSLGRLVLHWFGGALAAPSYYLFCNERLPGREGVILGGTLFFLLLWPVLKWGEGREKRRALWAIVLNGLPFLVVSLARAHFSLGQAFGQRYAVFTLIGVMFVVGTAWTVLSRKLPDRAPYQRLLPLGVLALVLAGQALYPPKIFRQFREESRIARETYRQYADFTPTNPDSPEEISRNFLMAGSDFPVLSQGQLTAIHAFLTARDKAF